MPAADRARVRTEVAREFFVAEHGRELVDARELAGQIAIPPGEAKANHYRTTKPSGNLQMAKTSLH
ncbi:MAG TPA: hypothetical protein VK390_13950 [Propionibacteriaceae bacterium]|nr:hypothetical protein [Propionibacteriaceae bacterium]